jgi:hypothetical protein
MAVEFLKWEIGCTVNHYTVNEEENDSVTLDECRCGIIMCSLCRVWCDDYDCYLCYDCAKRMVLDKYFDTICNHYLDKLKYVGFQSFWLWMYESHPSLEKILNRNEYEVINQYLAEVHSIFVKVEDLLPPPLRPSEKEDPEAIVGKILWSH